MKLSRDSSEMKWYSAIYPTSTLTSLQNHKTKSYVTTNRQNTTMFTVEAIQKWRCKWSTNGHS